MWQSNTSIQRYMAGALMQFSFVLTGSYLENLGIKIY